MVNVTSQLVNVTVIKDIMDTPVTVSKPKWNFSVINTDHNFLIPLSKISCYQLDSFPNSELRQLRSCPGDGLCSNHGRCDTTAGSCICNPGFEGTQCEG